MRVQHLLYSLLLSLAIAAIVAITPAHLRAQARYDNFGKEFYVAFGQNSGGTEDDNLMALYITSHFAAHGTVQVPAIGFSQNFTTTPGQISTIVLPSNGFSNNTVEIRTAEQVLPGMAVHITADTDVAVYGMNHKQWSSDAFMALPVNVLGTEYRAMCFKTSEFGTDQATPGEVWLAGVQDGTNITITPRDQTSTGRPANKPFNIILNRGEAYMVQGDPNVDANDITGTLIESDRPVAVFSGHQRTQMPEDGVNRNGTPSRDHLVEQLPPVSAWGDSAIVIPYATSSGADLVRVISAEDNNVVSVNGVAQGKVLKAGDFLEIPAIKGVTVIRATNPIMVGQYMHTSFGATDFGGGNGDAYGDPALALVFPVEQYTNSYTLINVENVAYTANFVNVVVDASGVASMTMDGVPIPASSFKAVPGSNFMYAQLKVQQGTHNFNGDKPFGLTVYALGPVDSYAYTGGTLIKTITPLKTAGLIIDFGDRELTPGDYKGTFDTTVYLKNVSEDPVTIYAFPKRTQDTGKFNVTKPDANPSKPFTIPPLGMDSMTIEFTPGVPNIRMHTQITAKTDHLRAYVVDVYGRGVIDSAASYSDPSTTHSMDTIDFGLFQKNDPPKDSQVYVGNLGLAKLVVNALPISGANASNFSVQGQFESSGAVSLPFTVDTALKQSAQINLRFTPDPVNGLKVAKLTIKSKNGATHDVVLLARVLTLEPPTATSIKFDSIIVCEPIERSITVNNTNDVPITIDSIVLSGTGAADYVPLTAFPLTIDPKSSNDVKVRFAPNNEGLSTATVTIYFGTPRGYTLTSTLTGFSSRFPFDFTASKNIHILGGESFTLPIFAKTDLAAFSTKGYTLHLTYDPTYIEDVDVVQDYTLSSAGYITIGGDIGDRTITYQTADGSTMTGGGVVDTIPLIYIKFNSTTNDTDQTRFHQAVGINYDLTLDASATIGEGCLRKNLLAGLVTIDSTCETVFLREGIDIPQEVYIAQNSPNPFNPSTVIEYDIPHETYTQLDILDVLGRPIRTLVSEVKKMGKYSVRLDGSSLTSGIYYARLSAAGVVKTRSMILAK